MRLHSAPTDVASARHQISRRHCLDAGESAVPEAGDQRRPGDLARAHNFSPTDERALEIIVFNEFMKLIDGMSMALQVLLGLIGALTLAIGGIGLANIMLVSVTQRTREIGVIKILGATRRTILMQFLLEAMAIVTAGGILGVSLGAAISIGVGTLPLLGPLFKDESGAGTST